MAEMIQVFGVDVLVVEVKVHLNFIGNGVVVSGILIEDDETVVSAASLTYEELPESFDEKMELINETLIPQVIEQCRRQVGA